MRGSTTSLRERGSILRRLRRALVRYLAKPVNRAAPSTAADAQSLSAVLCAGDVLLTEGTSRMAALVRRITGSSWAHASMYVGPLDEGADPCCVIEADVAAGVRAVPLSEFRGQRVRVLRLSALRDADRRRVVDWVVSRIGDEYDFAQAWAMATQLLRLPIAARWRPMPDGVARDAGRFICSTLLAQAFLLVGYPIAPTWVAVDNVTAAAYRYITPRDFECAAAFEVVEGRAT